MSEQTPKRIALVLNSLTGKELKGGRQDVSRVFSILTDPQQGMCQHNGSTPVYDCESKSKFEEILRSTLDGWEIKTQLVFYFSGHGEIKNNLYCLKMGLHDSDLYPFKNLMTELAMAGVERAIIILDACHSGAALEGTRGLGDDMLKSIEEGNDIPQGIAIITSSRKTQKSHELPDGSSGVFTDIFCKGIQTNLDGKGTNDGNIYVEDIVDYIKSKLETDEQYSKFVQRPVVENRSAEGKIWIAKGKKIKKIEDPTQSSNRLSYSVRTPEELKILYEKTLPNQHPCLQATNTKDIDLEVLEKYANRVEPDLYKRASSLEEVLSKLKLYSPIQHEGRNVLHKSAVLCFHKRPEMIYQQARSIFIFGRPRESNFVREDILGPLSYQVKALVDKVKQYSKTISNIAEDGIRREVQEIDPGVARELISNAIAHRDYQLKGTVTVAIKPEGLEVCSPGRFSQGLSWEQLINGIATVSSPVDEAISWYLSNLLVFEGIGRGFDVFKEHIKENGFDSIICKELPGPTTYIRVLRRTNGTIIQPKNDIVNQYKKLPHGSSLPTNNLPRSSSTCFVGREQELESLHQELQRKDCAIAGMGGIGKTELALQYAYKYGQQYPGGICLIKRMPLSNAGLQIVALAQTLLDLKPPENLPLTNQVQYCWHNWKGGDVLVIFDDVIQYEDIESFLPPVNPRFKVLITTRNKGLKKKIDLINIDVLAPDAALELLKSYLGSSRLEAKREAAEKILQLLGFHPRALTSVGSHLREKQSLSLEEMVSRLEAKLNPDITVNSAFEMSWKELLRWEEEEFLTMPSPFALAPTSLEEFSFILSLFALAPIPWSLVESCWPGVESEELESFRDKMLSLSLLEQRGKGSYQLHPLIREFISDKREHSEKSDKKEQLEKVENLKSRYVGALVAVAKTITENLTFDEIHNLAPNIPHLEEATTTLTRYLKKEDIVSAFTGLGRYYTSQGYYQQAQNCYERCLQEVQKRSESNDSDIATALNNLADIYRIQGRYAEAKPLFQEALQVWVKLLGHEHLNVASAFNNLASLYSAQGSYLTAEDLYNKALDLRKRLLGNEHPDVALSLKNVADIRYYQGRYSEAEALYNEALEINKRLFKGNHPAIAQTLNDLASVYYSQEDYTQAESKYLEALKMNKELFKSNHPSIAQTLNNLGFLYYSIGQYTEAKSFYQCALKMKRELFGDKHPDIAQTLNNLASLYQIQKHYDKAEALFKKAIELQRQALGVHPSLCISLNNLANFYLSQDRHNEAEPLLQEAIELQKQLLRESHPDTAISLYNLAFLYKSQGHYKKAENIFQKAIEIFEATLGENHNHIVLTREQYHINSLSNIILTPGKVDKIQE